MKYVSKEALVGALTEMNAWHPSVPTFLVFSKQQPGPEGSISGNTEAVREVFDSIFSLEHIGVEDAARSFYIRVAFGKSSAIGFGERGKTKDYGSKLQRTISDTIAKPNGPLTPDGGNFKLKPDFSRISLNYLKSEDPIDLRPLLLFVYWNRVADSVKYRDLWVRFNAEFHVDSVPFSAVFTCSQLDDDIPIIESEELPYDIKSIVLPNIFGTDSFDAAFWIRFKDNLDKNLKSLRWQGEPKEVANLSSSITSALMYDEAVFLVGDPGTGKTTLVEKVILPAMRKTIGENRTVMFYSQVITPITTQADLFGFQGLDGEWVAGPLSRQILSPYSLDNTNNGDFSEENDNDLENSLHVLFFDEANRVDIEGLLSPIQSALDSMRRREIPSVVKLGATEYTMPRKVWRIFAGNSPAADTGRREQSRPLKRRLSIVVPPNPVLHLINTPVSFSRAIFELLDKLTMSGDVEIQEPASVLQSRWKTNGDHIESLRSILVEIAKLPQVALTIGLIESVVMRTASHVLLERDKSVDSALIQSFGGLISGSTNEIRDVELVARQQGFEGFASFIDKHIIGSTGGGAFQIESII